MKGLLRSAREQFDQSWAGPSTPFETYERNRLLKTWTRGWNGHCRRMLDVGCGDGAVCEYFAALQYDVAGVDISEVGVGKAAQRVQGSFLVADVEEPLPFEDSIFDVVFWGDNAEHLAEPISVLKEIRRVLKPTGRLLLSCPNVGYWRFRILYLLRGSMPRSEGHVNPPWAWEHIRFFNPRILRDFLSAGGFRMRRLGGTTRDRLFRRLARIWPSLFATVIMAEAEPE